MKHVRISRSRRFQWQLWVSHFTVVWLFTRSVYCIVKVFCKNNKICNPNLMFKMLTNPLCVCPAAIWMWWVVVAGAVRVPPDHPPRPRRPQGGCLRRRWGLQCCGAKKFSFRIRLHSFLYFGSGSSPNLLLPLKKWDIFWCVNINTVLQKLHHTKYFSVVQEISFY